jgi:hypothetical protein
VSVVIATSHRAMSALEGNPAALHRLARGPRRWPELTRRHEDLDPAPVDDGLQAGRRQQPTQPEADVEIVPAGGVESAIRLFQRLDVGIGRAHPEHRGVDVDQVQVAAWADKGRQMVDDLLFGGSLENDKPIWPHCAVADSSDRRNAGEFRGAD